MAINPIVLPSDKTITLSHNSLNHHKHDNSSASRLIKMELTPLDSISSLSYKHGKDKSPYLKNPNHPILGDGVQLVSRVTEKRFVHKNGGNLSLLAGNIYNANSDEFKAKQTNKKVLKSVLTLPNNAATQLCTVSDMNDSEYLNGKENLPKKYRKRNLQVHVRKYRPYSKGLESESQYSSDIDLCVHSSSIDMIKKCGDGKRTHKSYVESKGKVKEKVKPHDVWAVLRNMNRFQFQTSPNLSEDSFLVRGQKKNLKPRNNRKDMRVFETRRTEEFAYISSYKVPKSPSLSHCSSFDKVTVIDKTQSLRAHKDIEDKPKKKKTGKHLGSRAIKNSLKNKALPVKQQRYNMKAKTHINQIDPKKNHNIPAIELLNTDNTNDDGELNEVLNNNASVDLGYESKTTENDEDFISFDHTTTNTAQASQCSQSKLSDNSGSSKAAAINTKKIVPNKVKPKLKVAPGKQINGITKVILSKGLNLEQPQQNDKIEPTKISFRQSTVTHRNPVDPPKLTKAEINRQLNKYRFPIVVLGKDQLRSSIHVVNSDHPQFDGLDQQIWPFMNSWYEMERPVEVTKRQMNSSINNKKTRIDEIDKKLKNNVTKPNKIPKIESKRMSLPLSQIINQTTQYERKLKPIKQLKDRMLKLLYKKSFALSVIDGTHNSSVTGKNENNITSLSFDISTDTQDRGDKSTKHSTTKAKKLIIEKRPWAKAKWASEFIENVIKKIKSGAYYNHDVIKIYDELLPIDTKEIDVQTDSIINIISNVSTNLECDVISDEPEQPEPGELIHDIAIPGFDNVQPVLEIETISLNEVAVKHCGTNITVHFDVTVPTDPMVGVKKDSSVILTNITKSFTRVFKCRTSIINAMLPAELCSIVPNMLRDIINTGQHHELFTAIDMPCLTTISEIPIQPDSLTDIPNSALPGPAMLLLKPLASILRQQLNGGYFKNGVNKTPNFHILRNITYLVKYESSLSEDLRPHIARNLLFHIESQLKMPFKVIHHKEQRALPTAKIEPIEQVNTCTALQLYQGTNHRPIAMHNRPFSLMNLFETMASYINNIELSCFRMIKTDSNLEFNMNTGNTSSTSKVTLRITALKADSFSDFSKFLPSTKISILTDADKTNNSSEKVKICAICEKDPENKSSDTINVRRKGYNKLYRKCRSASIINGEKNTPLNRIANLDDFFHVLGPGELLSSVFDGQSGNKIMASIKEFKKWTTVINPRQALLVVLLVNKKETTNVLRYRPMLLQGIAVKRITKAIELDMEIEVIERENLHGASQFEGISYLPASVENQDNLYEELCWIAKNTASDYQKPFDHTSERLLRSLLEKRKQLNPSYLRVMARYVGLGLLKSPGKKQ